MKTPITIYIDNNRQTKAHLKDLLRTCCTKTLHELIDLVNPNQILKSKTSMRKSCHYMERYTSERVCGNYYNGNYYSDNFLNTIEVIVESVEIKEVFQILLENSELTRNSIQVVYTK